MDVRRMLLLTEAADRGSISAAADALAITPSAASQQLSRLEAESGQPLVERLPRGVRLTGAGEAMAARGRRIRSELRGAQADLDSFARLTEGSLRMGSFPTASSSLLPLALTRFSRKHPGVRVTVRSSLLAGLQEFLHAGEVELAILWDYEWNRVEDEALRVTHLLDDPMVLVVPANSELLERSGVDLAELADQKWITRTENPVAEVLHRSCRLAGFEPDISYESHDYHEAQAMVAAGLGIAIAPRLALTNRRHDERLIAFESRGRPAPARRILLARPVNRTPTPATEVMTETLRAVAPKFAATNLHLAQLGTVRAR